MMSLEEMKSLQRFAGLEMGARVTVTTSTGNVHGTVDVFCVGDDGPIGLRLRQPGDSRSFIPWHAVEGITWTPK